MYRYLFEEFGGITDAYEYIIGCEFHFDEKLQHILFNKKKVTSRFKIVFF